MMNILILTGSPHKNGTSSLLADKFMEGAQENGHYVLRFDAAFKKVGGCQGCDYCRIHGCECVQKDDMQALYAPLLAADLVVFVTPLYYYGMTAQLKSVIDRFYAVDRSLRQPPKGAMLIATCNNQRDWAMQALEQHYLTILKHLGWQDRGILLAQGMGVRADIENSEFPQKAKELGLSL